jgi:hypothetical protein
VEDHVILCYQDFIVGPLMSYDSHCVIVSGKCLGGCSDHCLMRKVWMFQIQYCSCLFVTYDVVISDLGFVDFFWVISISVSRSQRSIADSTHACSCVAVIDQGDKLREPPMSFASLINIAANRNHKWYRLHIKSRPHAYSHSSLFIPLHPSSSILNFIFCISNPIINLYVVS